MSVKSSRQDEKDLRVRDMHSRGPKNKPKAILQAAFDVFSAKGFSAARLDDVARRAGVAKGTLYLYFDSKEALFKTVVKKAVALNIKPLEKRLENHQGPVFPLLEEVFQFLGKQLSETRLGVFPKIIIAEANNFPDLAIFYRDEVINRIQGFFASLIKKGIRRGEFQKVRPEPAARILMAPFLMLALVSNIPVFQEGLKINAKEHADLARELLGYGLVTRKGETS